MDEKELKKAIEQIYNKFEILDEGDKKIQEIQERVTRNIYNKSIEYMLDFGSVAVVMNIHLN